MKITVLNGSPKGEISVTYQYFRYLTKIFPEIDFEVSNISQEIKSIEKNREKFNNILSSIKSSDAILWITPVYHFTIPGQLKRFIEMIFENNCTDLFEDKYSTLLTTSIHFYDHMAENYIHGVSEDMGMKYIKGFLAHMNYLEKKENRKAFTDFFADFKRKVEHKISVNPSYSKIKSANWDFNPVSVEEYAKSKKHRVLAITDIKDQNSNIATMLETYQKSCQNDIETLNLNEISIKNGCLGCCACGGNNECTIKDDLIEIYKEKMKNADGIIYFSEIQDRYLSSNFKIFFDRSFVNGHAPIYMGKQVQYILSGPFSQIDNLREEIKARAEVSQMNLVDIISDEVADNEKLTKMLKDSAENMIYAIEHNLKPQSAFYETAGHKIFRDFVFGSKAIFSADHRFYKKINFYDFPNQNYIKRIFVNLLYFILKIKKIRKKLNEKMKYGMIMKLKKIVDSL